MKFYDLTLPLETGMPVWPGDTRFWRAEKYGTAIVSKIIMSSHTGTHIDAPKHFLFDQAGVDKIALRKLIGKCHVIEISFPSPGGGEGSRERSKANSQIQISDLQRFRIKAGDRILFKTRNSKLLQLPRFTANYVSLSLPAARYLAAKKINLVGIDYFGIEAKGSAGHPVHKTLLRAEIVIVEGLNLSKINPGIYNLIVLPLNIKDSDGSPARVILY